MRLIHTGVAALNQTPFDWSGNRRRIVEVMERARKEEVSLLCLPELCITGYQCEDIFGATALQERAATVLFDHVAPASKDLVVSVGLPVYHQGALYNAVALLVDGRVAGISAKQFLAGDGIHYEPRWFKPWPAGERTLADIHGHRIPFGDLYHDVGGIRIGFEVCEDAWVADRPGTRLAKAGVDVIFNPSASHFAFDKQDVRRRFVLEGSRAFGAAYLYANLLGNEAGRAIYDGGTLIAQSGRVLVEGPRLSFREYQLCTAALDIDHSRSLRCRLPSFRTCPVIDPNAVVRTPYAFPQISPRAPRGEPAPFEASPRRKEEELTRAVTLGLFDYLRKSRSGGYVVSLSGGADSSACAVLVALMARLATDELGIDGFRQRLPHLSLEGQLGSTVKALLVTLYQATANSSETTRRAARTVAEAIGAEHHELDVEPVVQRYRSIAEAALGRTLTWEQDDLALQNIQARARAPSAWMMANLRGMLLCATSNRSEAAVGYTTMDGDTCGGLSPIAGIDKAFLQRWLRWMEEEGPIDVGPIPALAVVNSQAPTAELRPSAAAQTDEADLMPYPILDAIERLAIRDKYDPVACFRLLRHRFPEHGVEQLRNWVRCFFELWCRNQWKRERYAPSFHLDDENLDPKTWCRFPILSGGFETELAELEVC